MSDFFLVFIPTYLPVLLVGAVVTIQLALVSMVGALVIGLAVAIGRLHGPSWLDFLLRGYLEVWRGVPLIVQLLVIYFTLPEIGVVLPAFWAGAVGLSLNLGAYLSEVFRAAILSVEKGQREAATSIGMPLSMAYRRIILPQAAVVALPTAGGYFIALLKDCSLVSFISVSELLRRGQILVSSTFKTMEIYLLVALIYFAMSFITSLLVRWLENRLTPQYLRRSAANAPIDEPDHG